MELQTISHSHEDSEAEESLFQFFKEENEREETEKKRIQDEENAKIEAERIAEELRTKELARAKNENPVLLFKELTNTLREQSEFFEKCHYDTILE